MSWGRELNFLVGFALKPAVLVLGLLAIAAARRLPAGRNRSLLGLSFVAFVVGELFCAVDVYVRRGMSPIDESAHDLFMAAAFSLFAMGIYEHIRAAGRCLNLRCARSTTGRLPAAECPESADFGPLAGWAMLGAAAMGVIPILARPGALEILLPAGLGGRSFGAYLYARTVGLSFLQQKFFPALAMTALALAALSYRKRRKLTAFGAWSAALGAGTLTFAFNRLILVHAFYPEVVLTAVVEEALEALFLVFALAWLRSARHGATGSSGQNRRI
jgi:hypothetical protein